MYKFIQDEWSIYTTNLIDSNIWLQFTRIEEYLLNFFLGVRSAFKGRIRSNQAMIGDQSCLDWIAIKSRMRGDHEELKILLQNCSISSRFNQEFSIQRGEEPVLYKKSAKIADRRIPKVLMHPRVTPRLPKMQFKLDRSMFTYTINSSHCARSFDGDWADSGLRDRCILFNAIASNVHSAATYPAHLELKGT